MSKKQWRPEEEGSLIELYPHVETEILAAMYGTTRGSLYQKASALGLKKSPESLSRSARRAALVSNGMATRFKPGQTPWNAGLAGTGLCPSNGKAREHHFKPGHLPHTYKPVGTEIWNDEGYLERKIADPNKWACVHRLIWAEAHGPIPKGHSVVFRDGNRANITLDNLELISRAELMRRNTIHRYPQELKDSIRAVASLKRKIRKVEERSNEEQHG